MLYPGPAFQRLRERPEVIRSMGPELLFKDWHALRRWHDKKLMASGKITSCGHWAPNGMPGFIYLDVPTDKLRTTVLCQRCFNAVSTITMFIGFDGDFTCNLCDTEPENHQFTEIIIALEKNVILCGHICDSCIADRGSVEEA